MILLPSRARPAKCARFLEAYVKTGATEPGLLMIEARDEEAYAGIKIPRGWARITVPQSLVGRKFNDGAMVYAPNEDFYFVCGDDMVPETAEWDARLREASGRDGISSGDDGIMREKLPAHPCVGGEFVRALGYLANPLFGHFWWDNALGDLASAIGAWTYLPDVKMPHLHHSITGDRDTAWSERGYSGDDKKIYDKWRAEGFAADLEKLKSLRRA